MFYSYDPVLDAERWIASQEKRKARLPICERCGEHIQDENLWDIDGVLYCPECAKEEFERQTENYIED